MSVQQHPPIYRRSDVETLPANRFEGDLFDREKLADRLTGFFDRLPDGAVLAIDSPWGEGKTWFGKRWRAKLTDQNYRTAYVDCFDKDYMEDPFSMIASELIALAKGSKTEIKTKLREGGMKLGAALLPAAAKLTVGALAHWAVGNAEIGTEAAKKISEGFNKNVGESLEKLVAKRFEDYEENAKTVASFKAALTDLAAEGDKPIIIFLDELDRCRPDFAVKTIERIKHFFEAPKVIFVVLLNRRQLEAAIHGMYGSEVNAEAYIGKFVQLSLTLPKVTSLDGHAQDDNRRHCGATLERFGFAESPARNTFVMTMGMMASAFGLSLRDVERAATLYSFAQPEDSWRLAWPITIKLTNPELFARILANDHAAHREAYQLLSQKAASAVDISDELKLYAEIHNCASSGFGNALATEQGRMLSGQGILAGPKALFEQMFKRIDLSIAK